MAYRPERGWGFSHQPADAAPAVSASELEDLKRRIAELESNASRTRRSKTANDKGSAGLQRTSTTTSPDDKGGSKVAGG